MAKLETGETVIEARLKAAIAAHKDKIIDEFIKQAHDQGHNINKSDINSVTLHRAKDLSFAVENFDIGKFVIQDPDVPVKLDGTEWNNNADTPGQVNFKVNETTEDTYNWSMTAGVKTGLKVTAGIEYGLPENKGKMSVEASIEASVSTTSGTAHKKTRTWEKDVGQTVNPYTHFRMDVYGVQLKGYAPYTITSRVSGKALVRIKYSFHGDRNKTPEIDVRQLLSQKDQRVSVEGQITGLQGYDWDIQSESHPLTAAEKTSLPIGLKEVGGSVRTLELA